MYNCQNCAYALTITKMTTAIQGNIIAITDPSEFIKIYVNRRKKVTERILNVDTALELNFELNSLVQQLQKSNIKDDIATTIIEKFNIIKKNMKPNTFCLECTKCNEVFVLPSGIISSIKVTKILKIGAVENPAEIITDLTLERTKDFICPNKECDKNTSLLNKEAVYYRPTPEEYITKLICANCYTVF